MEQLKFLHQQLLNRPWVGVAILFAFYFFGTAGIIAGYEEWFIKKTAFNLLLSFLILILYQKHPDYKLLICLGACYIIGFTVEFLGVNYGLIFGDYYYPLTLGGQLAGVPLIIGINWFIITFVVWVSIAPIKMPVGIRLITATILTVLIDLLIEPVAMALDFWQWDNDTVPLQNYVGWAVISFLIFTIYHFLKVSTDNKLAISLLALQLIFFVSLNIWLLV